MGAAVLTLILMAGQAKADSAIVVRPHTQMSETRAIRLIDVAEFSGLDGQVVTEVGKLKLAEGPKAGERIEFSGAAISALLRDHLVWRKGAEKPALTIPSRVVVENIGNRVTEAQVRMELVQRWQSQCNCRVEITELTLPRLDKWQDGTVWQLRLPSEVARGTFNVALEMTPPNGLSQTLWVRGRVSHFKSVPVARRQLNLGERVQPEDFTFADRDVTFARDSVPGDGEIVGRKLRQSVSADGIIFAGLLERERALRRGDQVKMTMSEESWQVDMVGVAEQDGFVGDVVKVKNPRSNQSVMAVVTGRGEVKVQ